MQASVTGTAGVPATQPGRAATWSPRRHEAGRPIEGRHPGGRRAASESKVWQHQQPRNGRGLPAEPLPCDPGGQADLGIVSAEGFLDRVERRLHLDDQQESGPRMPGEHVDRSTFGVDRIGSLRSNSPSDRLQHLAHAGNECCMAFIGQTVQVAAAPAHVLRQLHLQDPEDQSNCPDPGGCPIDRARLVTRCPGSRLPVPRRRPASTPDGGGPPVPGARSSHRPSPDDRD